MKDSKHAEPTNRIQLYKYLLRHRFVFVMNISWVVGLFALPLMVLGTITTMVNIGLWQQVIDSYANIDGDFVANFLFQQIMASVYNVPLYMLWIVGIGGVLPLVKKFVWRQAFLFAPTLRKALSDSWRSSLLIGLFVGLAVLAFKGMFWYIAIYCYGTVLLPIAMVLFGVVAVLVLWFFVYCLCIQSVYNISFLQTVKSSAFFSIINFHKHILLSVLVLLPFGVILMYPTLIAFTITLSIYLLLYFGVALVGVMLFAVSVLDKHINITQYPQLVGRGIKVLDEQ